MGTLLIYSSTLVAVRLAGRRTVARISAFDQVVTIALGSVIATTALAKNVPFLNGVVAVVVLLLLQVSVAALRQRSQLIRRFTDFEPQVMYEDGKFDLPSSPLSAQPTQAEIESKLRQRGLTDWSKVDRIILEPDGKVSVLLR